MAEIVFETLSDERVIYVSVAGDLTIQEWQATGDQLRERLQLGVPPVHVIIDGTNVQKHPLDPRSIISATSWLKEDNMGWLVVLTNSAVIKMLATITIQAFMARYRQFTTLDEAIEFLLEVDSSLHI